MSKQPAPESSSDADLSALEQGYKHNAGRRNSDDELMVYETPRDYAALAKKGRDHLIADGIDPNAIILESELKDHIIRRANESTDDFANRYGKEMNAMIERGVYILNDVCTADVVPSVFQTGDGRTFDLGPGSGATKKEFREFSQWYEEGSGNGQLGETPKQWAKFESIQ